VFPPWGGYAPPGVLIPPPFPIPPCNPETDEDCPPPPPPPTDVPEPGTLFILLIGAAALWLGTRAPRPALEKTGGSLRDDNGR